MRLLVLLAVLLGCDMVPIRDEMTRQWQDGDLWCTERVYTEHDGTRSGLVFCEPLEGEKEVR